MLTEVIRIDGEGFPVEFYVKEVKFDEEGQVLLDDGFVLPYNHDERFFKPRYDIVLNKWVENDFEEVLSNLKESKFKELNAACNQTILGYFKAAINDVEYDFSFDNDAQSNFNGTLSFFIEGLISQVEWTAWKDGVPQRVIMNKSQFMTVVMTAFQHKNSNIARLRNDLQPKLYSITVDTPNAVEEIEAIIW